MDCERDCLVLPLNVANSKLDPQIAWQAMSGQLVYVECNILLYVASTLNCLLLSILEKPSNPHPCTQMLLEHQQLHELCLLSALLVAI